MNTRTSCRSWIVSLVVVCVLSSLAAQEQRDPREGFLQMARQAPAAEWPDRKQQFLSRVRANLGRETSDSEAVERAVTAIGQILDEARTLSDAEFEQQHGKLLDRWHQAARGAVGGSPPLPTARPSNPPAAADVQPDGLFSEGAVLQRGAVVPVWGKAKAGTQVTVEFCGQTATAIADSGGQWMVHLGKLTAGGPFRMVMRGKSAITLTNVCVGDVWLCSGQSNMQFPLEHALTGAAAIPSANDPQLRFTTVPEVAADPPTRSEPAAWQVCNPQSAAGFSAVGYFFGRDLRRTLGVPVGLILCARHSTYVEAWADRATLHRVLPAAFERDDRDFKNRDQAMARYRENHPGDASGPGPFWSRPCIAFEGMLTPLLPFPITGVIWYQGEANSFHTTQTKEYPAVFPAVIGCWRKAWGLGDFPFLFVQHPGGFLPELREAQFISWQKTKNTAMVVTIDHGPTANDPVGGLPWWNNDRHPKDKEPVGARLALAARALAYGEKIEYSGPVFRRMTLAGHQAILSFDHVGTGLAAKGGPLKGFTLAGANKHFVAAEAVISGSTVIVSSAQVTQPAAARYGWDKNPGASLFNKEGLPATPFRTDVE